MVCNGDENAKVLDISTPNTAARTLFLDAMLLSIVPTAFSLKTLHPKTLREELGTSLLVFLNIIIENLIFKNIIERWEALY